MILHYLDEVNSRTNNVAQIRADSQNALVEKLTARTTVHGSRAERCMVVSFREYVTHRCIRSGK